MHTARDERFDDEAARFRLAFTCDECGHFDAARGACAHEWPDALHRLARYQRPSDDVVFCKEFETR